MHSPVSGRTIPFFSAIEMVMGILILAAVVFIPASAQPQNVSHPGPFPNEGQRPEGFAGHFSQGVPVYWPYHALLMATGFILLLAGAIIARYHKTANWYRSHRVLQAAGAACIIAGLVVGLSMVALSGLPHFVNLHEIAGMVTIILVLLSVALGFAIRRTRESKDSVRKSHRWLGRISLVLLAIDIILGILILSMILRR